MRSLSMVALEVYLRSIVSPCLQFFNEHTAQLEDLQNELVDINQRMNTIQSKADGEKRPLGKEENETIDALLEKFYAVEDEIDRRKHIAEANERLSKPSGRKTQPDDGKGKPLNRPAARTNPAWMNDKDKWGWDSFGQFAKAVKRATMPGGYQERDPRLSFNVDSNITAGSSDPGEDGGFAIPPDFRREIMVQVSGEDSLVARTDQYTTDSNGVSFPADATTPWGTAGIQAYWLGEGQQKPPSKPVLNLVDIKLHKLAALINMTDELLEDVPAMSTYLRNKTPQVIGFKVNDAIVNGTGDSSLMPSGILESSAKVTVPPEGSSAGDPLTYADIVNMWAALYAPCRRNAIWLVNQAIEASMFRMAFPGTGTAVPVYLPQGGLSVSPFATLLGRPVIPTEAAAPLGTEGDIILVDLTKYATVQKTSGLRQDVSIHLYFDYDITSFRFVMRFGGKPWWTGPVEGGPGQASSQGGVQRSCIVTLGDRS